jgi:pimeloyl-ACP methyl ester carboxylesterase
MRPSARKIAGLLLASCAWASAGAISAQARIGFAPCADGNNFACGHLAVPLDPSGATPGTLTLAMRRHRAPIEGLSSAVIPLAGGPGQAAIPLTEAFLELLGPIAATRDVIVFDQRGTGLSHALSCRAPRRRGRVKPTLAQSVLRCADGLGAGRAFYTTPESVADIEAIRRAGGYEKLVLYGTSYGTKVAEQYAQAYPEHVETLVLDSVVPPNGPDPLNRSTFAAIPRILNQLCSHHECVHITRDPVSDLQRVIARARRRAIVGRVIDKRGRPRREPITSDALLGVLLDGDFNPLFRAELIPAARAAANGDSAALARLLARDEGLAAEGGGGGVDEPLFLATTCEEEAFPWSRTAPPGARLKQATRLLDGLPQSTFAPFTSGNAYDLSVIPACAFWPYSSPAPTAVGAALPNVPALILSGEADLRTPTANAREVAAQIPDSHLLVVPHVGHSVLINEPTPCASDALQAIFAGHPLRPCKATPPPAVLRLPPLPPARLASVPAARGYHGLVGRTLHGASLTFADFSRQFALALIEALSSGNIFSSPSVGGGGLRAGWWELREKTIVLHGYSYVPGLTVSGSVSPGKVAVGIGGPAAAHGYLRSEGHRALSGALGGVPVRLPSAAGISRARPAPPRHTPGLAWAREHALLASIGEALQQLPGSAVTVGELNYLATLTRASETPPAR